MLRPAIVPAVVVALLTSASSAQVALTPAFKEGSQFETQEITILQQTLTIAGMETVTRNESITTTVATVGKRNAAGLLEVRQRTKALQVSLNAQGMDYFFDSANPDKRGDSMLEVFRDVHKVMARLVAIAEEHGEQHHAEDRLPHVFALEHRAVDEVCFPRPIRLLEEDRLLARRPLRGRVACVLTWRIQMRTIISTIWEPGVDSSQLIRALCVSISHLLQCLHK